MCGIFGPLPRFLPGRSVLVVISVRTTVCRSFIFFLCEVLVLALPGSRHTSFAPVVLVAASIFSILMDNLDHGQHDGYISGAYVRKQFPRLIILRASIFS